MKKTLIILSLILLSNIIVFSQTKKILFLGNSYTAVNNLPDKVSLLAASLGDSVYYESNTPGGYRLLNHATNSTTLSLIGKGGWDYVVIQAQSQEPSWPPGQVASQVLPYAIILNDSIKSANPCTETVFYMTWGRKYGDQQNCASWPPVCTFLGMQERLMTGYMTMTEQNSSTVAPVGLSWKHTMDNDPDSLINLYAGDNSHPSLAGTYLTACVMYATMFQKSPVGAGFSAGLPVNDALFLQQMAEDVVLSKEYNFSFYDTYTSINYDLGWKSWFDFGNIAFAGFSFSGIDATFSFYDSSLNAETYLWDFGDGITSSVQNPTHTYTTSDIFIVKQLITNPCFNDVAYDTVNVDLSALNEVIEQDIVSISPNPGNGIFKMIIKSHEVYDVMHYKVFDLNGRLIDQSKVTKDGDVFKKQINLSSFNTGLYYLRIYLNYLIINKVLIIH